MKICAFMGSPRKDGNTGLLLREAVRGIEEEGFSVQVFDLNSMNIRPCQNCGGCNETGVCINRDDMDQIYDAIRSSDRIILASPIYFFALSAQTKLMIDRCQCFWCEKYLLRKPLAESLDGRKGLLLLVGGMMADTGVQCSEACARAFFRTISFPEHDVLSYLGIDKKGDILKHKTALEDAYDAGKRLIEI